MPSLCFRALGGCPRLLQQLRELGLAGLAVALLRARRLRRHDDDALFGRVLGEPVGHGARERRCISSAVEVEPQLRARVHLVHVLAAGARRAAELPIECARCAQGVEGAAAIGAEPAHLAQEHHISPSLPERMQQLIVAKNWGPRDARAAALRQQSSALRPFCACD